MNNEGKQIVKVKAIADKMGWKYYLPEAEQTHEVRTQLTTNHYPLTTEVNIEDVNLLDLCMGSGHILIYAFDALIQMYRTAGYADRETTKLILEKNLYGLDIDKRAYQLAYFSQMMKARQYNRHIFGENVKPQIYHPGGWQDGEEFGSLNKISRLERKPEANEGQMDLYAADTESILSIAQQSVLISQTDWDAFETSWDFKRHPLV